MRSMILMCAVLMAPFAAFAKGGVPTEVEKKAMEKSVICAPPVKTPEEKCRERHGKWVDGMCEKTRVVKKRVVRRVKVRTAPPMNFELKCYRQGGEWRNGLCYGKNDPAPVIAPPPAPSISLKQEQSVTVKNSAPPPSATPKKTPKAKSQWWWMGVGVWGIGLWAGQQDFVPGIHGTLIFAINKRFRVGGSIGVGYGPWQDNGKLDVWFGGTFAVRTYQNFFVNFNVETFWGGFDGLSVHRRMIAASAGPEYWFGDRASIGLRFLVGLHDNVESCQVKSGQVVGGNLFTTSVYF